MYKETLHHCAENIEAISGRLDSMIEGLRQTIAKTALSPQAEVVVTSKEPAAMLDLRGDVLYTNQPFCDFTGLRPDEASGIALTSIIEPDYHAAFNKALQDTAALETSTLFRARNAYGGFSAVECSLLSYVDQSGKKRIALLHDISAIKKVSEQMQELEEHYSTLSETISESILRVDDSFNIVFANSAVKRTFGYTKEELQGKNLDILFPPEIFQRYKGDILKLFFVDDEHRKELGLEQTFEILGHHKQRGVSPMEISFGNSSQFKGRTLTCIIRDITHRKNTERKLRKLALHDKLTNLGNRDLFNTDMSSIFTQMVKYPSLKGALLFLDLDGFKQINDTLGHSAGDELLIETAKRLLDCLRQTDSIYRFGGDEFVIALQKIENKEDAALVADKVLKTIRRPYILQSKNSQSSEEQPIIASSSNPRPPLPDSPATDTTTVVIGVSIGIALFPEHGRTIETVVQNADLAMYESKDAGKNCFKFYHADMVSKATIQLQLEQGIKRALTENAFNLHYQPLVCCRCNIKGVEALVRWNDPKLGKVPPSRFIPIAEDKGLIIPLGNWVLEKALTDIVELNKNGYPDLYVSVNISPIQLEQKDFTRTMDAIIKRTQVNPANVKLEITETSIMRHPEESIEKLWIIKEEYPEISILIDDFGTGYSSLSYMAKLPVDTIKIDISFVAKLFQGANLQIVKTIMHLAESLDLKIIAEGIETEKQRDYFRHKKCEAMQGFLFSKGVGKKKLYQLLKSGTLKIAQA